MNKDKHGHRHGHKHKDVSYKKKLYLHVRTLALHSPSGSVFYTVIQDDLKLTLKRVSAELLSTGQRHCALGVTQRARRIANWQSATQEPTRVKKSYGQVYARLGKGDEPKLFRTCTQTTVTSIGKDGHVYCTTFRDKGGRKCRTVTYFALLANIKRFGLAGAMGAVRGDKVLAAAVCRIMESKDLARYELPNALRAAKTLRAKRGVVIQYLL